MRELRSELEIEREDKLQLRELFDKQAIELTLTLTLTLPLTPTLTLALPLTLPLTYPSLYTLYPIH